MAVVIGRLPSLQGMCSTTTPCSGHCTRLGAYKNPRHDPPQRHKEPPTLRQSVITGSGSAALRAFATQASMRGEDNPLVVRSIWQRPPARTGPVIEIVSIL